MALIAEVRTRIGSQRLNDLTRANESAESQTEDTVRLTAAVADAEAAFRLYAQQEYDDADADKAPRHISLGVRGVVLHLEDWARGSELTRAALDRWYKDLEQLAHTTVRARITPEGTTTFLDYPEETDRRSVGDRRGLGQFLMRTPSGRGGGSFEEIAGTPDP